MRRKRWSVWAYARLAVLCLLVALAVMCYLLVYPAIAYVRWFDDEFASKKGGGDGNARREDKPME